MKTQLIRKKIADAIRQEDQTHALASHFTAFYKQTGHSMTSEQINALVTFVKTYVNYIPDRLEEVEAACKNESWWGTVSTFLNAAQDYFLEANDVIPDSLGLAGLTDDAYLAHSLLERIADNVRQQTGKQILSVDSKQVNQFMRTLIGEPFVSILDNNVQMILQGTNMQNAVSQLIALIAGGAANVPSYSFNDYAIKQQVDHQMAMVTSSFSPSW
jgi:uncharacterized membrane protein YkvA (DUF1232 family)